MSPLLVWLPSGMEGLDARPEELGVPCAAALGPRAAVAGCGEAAHARSGVERLPGVPPPPGLCPHSPLSSAAIVCRAAASSVHAATEGEGSLVQAARLSLACLAPMVPEWPPEWPPECPASISVAQVASAAPPRPPLPRSWPRLGRMGDGEVPKEGGDRCAETGWGDTYAEPRV